MSPLLFLSLLQIVQAVTLHESMYLLTLMTSISNLAPRGRSCRLVSSNLTQIAYTATSTANWRCRRSRLSPTLKSDRPTTYARMQQSVTTNSHLARAARLAQALARLAANWRRFRVSGRLPPAHWLHQSVRRRISPMAGRWRRDWQSPF